MTWTPEHLIQLFALLGTAVAFIFSKNAVDAIIRFADWWRIGREKRLAQQALDEELNDKGHKYIIRRQDRRITELEDHNKVLAKEHLHCREENASLRSELERMSRRISYLENERKQK